MKKARNISTKTIKSLYAHSGNICAFPGCNQLLVCREDLILSNICHIYGLNSGSARYDDTKKEIFLNSEENLLLLCPTHQDLVDKDEKRYPPEALMNMKKRGERYVKEVLLPRIRYNMLNVDYCIEEIYQYYINEIGFREVTKEEVKKRSGSVFEATARSKNGHDENTGCD